MAALLLSICCFGASPAEAAFPGSNGKIAFVRSDTPGDPSSVYTVAPDGSGLTALTVSTGLTSERAPAWSADGRKIAYQELGGVRTIRKMDFDGRANVPVSFPGIGYENPAWSPDATQIAVRGGGSGNALIVMNADGSGAHNVNVATTVNDPVWSPDGTKIAFTRNGDVWTVAPNGTGLTNLTGDNALSDSEPNWSPDGSKIVFRSGGAIWTMNLDGTGKTMIKSSGAQPAWSPDGTRIAYVSGGLGGLRTMDPDGGNDVLVLSGSVTSPDWQPCAGPCPVSPWPLHDTPAGANQAYIAFVPNYRQTISDAQCKARGGAVSQHGPPLAFSSCNPPVLPPGTVAHQGPNGESGVIYTSNSGINIEGGGTDILTNLGGDYNPAGSEDATLVTKVRVTDTFSGPDLNEPATGMDFDLSFRIACTPDPDPAFGSTCAGATNTGALLGAESFRPYRKAVIQLFEVRMKDIGVNGVIGDSDDQSFVIQGISIP